MRLLIPILLVVPFAGCGSDGPVVYSVQGTVKFDGEPIEEGTITFLPADGQGREYGGPIQNGEYEVQVAPGKKDVVIHASKEDKSKKRKDPDGNEFYERVSYIPEVYNEKTTLTVEISEGGRHDFLELSSDNSSNK